MLVLSRKKNESIVINNDITIVVVEIRGDKVRLGVEAPREVAVHRREVYDAILRDQGKTDDPQLLLDSTKSVEKAMVDAGALEVIVPTVSKVENAVIQVPMPVKPELKWKGE